MDYVIKRDGRRVPYNREKIAIAIQKANAEVDPAEQVSDEQIYNIIASIENRGYTEMSVENIQDIIVQKLMAAKKYGCETVNVVPQPKAGGSGSFADIVWKSITSAGNFL